MPSDTLFAASPITWRLRNAASWVLRSLRPDSAVRGRVRDDPIDRVEDVPKVDRIVLHKEMASARTRSRVYGLSPSSVTTSTRRPSTRSASSQKAMKSDQQIDIASRSGLAPRDRPKNTNALDAVPISDSPKLVRLTLRDGQDRTHRGFPRPLS